MLYNEYNFTRPIVKKEDKLCIINLRLVMYKFQTATIMFFLTDFSKKKEMFFYVQVQTKFFHVL